MDKIEEAIIEIKKRLANIKSVFGVILYGSVSRGDYSIRHSDIDILVILEDIKIKDKVNKSIDEININYRVKIHPEYQTNKIEYDGQTLLCKMFEEGKVLFSKGTWFMKKEKLGLEAFRLYRFDTSSLNNVGKVVFSRALRGRKNQNGLIDNVNVIDAGKGGLLVKKNWFNEIEQFFDRFKVKYAVVKTLYG